MGAGYRVAEKMGIVPDLEKVDINISKLPLLKKTQRKRQHELSEN